MATGLQDAITLLPTSSTGARHKPLLIYFICGNPGLIEYYHAFLLQIRHQLEATGHGDNITIYGASHDGFEIQTQTSRTASHSPPYSLREEIEAVKRRLQFKTRQLAGSHPDEPLQVVLMGHSVGSYMLLEVLAWWQKHGIWEKQKVYSLVGGLCLFPTVVDIAKSPRGRILSWVLAIPFLPLFLQYVARCIALVPTSWFNWPKMLNPGPEAVDVTEAMIRSPYGVRQIIYMAKDEMREIKEDKWHPANIWGMRPRQDGDDTTSTTMTLDSSTPKTKLFFYWGKNDYWVNNQSRDALIAARAKQTSGMEESVRMFVDPGEIPHTFSLETKDMVTVAEKAAEYIAELQKSLESTV